MENTAMATNGQKAAKKPQVRTNKPRTFYMAYKGELSVAPKFVFDKDELVDLLTQDREYKVERITVPQGKRQRQKAGEPQVNPVAPTA
jgi:ketosteroid isomerase-like protein